MAVAGCVVQSGAVGGCGVVVLTLAYIAGLLEDIRTALRSERG